MNRKMMREQTQNREIEKCKENTPEYLKYLTLDICGTKMVQMNRLFKYDITPETNPEIFEIIKTKSQQEVYISVSDVIEKEKKKRDIMEILEEIKENSPEYFNKFVDYLNNITDSFKLSEINRLLSHDITPETNPEVFEFIKTIDYICDLDLRNYINAVIDKDLSKKQMEKDLCKFYKKDLPSVDDYERINIYSCNYINGIREFPDYIHVEVEILRGSLQDKINFATKHKKLIRDKVFVQKIYNIFGENAKFLKLYEYKFYSKPTVADSGLVIGLLRFEWKEV